MVKNTILQLLKLGYPLFQKLLPYQVYTYLATGALNTALNIGIFMLCYQLLHTSMISVEAATAVALLLTILSGYWLQMNFVFTEGGADKKRRAGQLSKYALVAVQGQLSAYLLTKTMIIVLHLNASFAYILTTIFMLTVNYFLQKYFTFKKAKRLS